MKTVYIPHGETVSYENLTTERLVVKGCLKVSCDLKAKTISGGGFIEAGRVFADDIRADDLECASVACARLITKRVETSELFASESAAVSCLLSADYVKAGRLFVGLSDIDEVEADEIINLRQKKRSLFRFLLASSLRSWWTRLTAPAEDVVDADYEPADEHKNVYQIGAQRSGSDLERRSGETDELSA